MNTACSPASPFVGCNGNISQLSLQPHSSDGGLTPYRDSASNPYRGSLVRCSNPSISNENICNLQELPFIGLASPRPTIDDLLNRVVVSHQWMGARFEAAVKGMSGPAQRALLQLSRSLTAIVIDTSINGPFYDLRLSSVYLDPGPMAVTTAEKTIVNRSAKIFPDVRGGNRGTLGFVGPSRYVTSDNRYFFSNDAAGRTQCDVTNYLITLLFHEFAHANDFYPPSVVSSLSCSTGSGCGGITPFSNLSSRGGRAQAISSQFGSTTAPKQGDYHLHSQIMREYSGLVYGSNTPTAAQLAWRGADVGAAFGTDFAVHEYAYAGSDEDVAMLTEAVLTKCFYNADIDMGYVDKPTNLNTIADQSIAWGVRGQLGNPSVKRRAQRFVEAILPGVVPASFYEGLAEPRLMQTSCSWADNLDLVCG